MDDNNQIPVVQNSLLNPNYITGQMNFIFRARMLWRDLASWLATYVISLYSGLRNTQAISERLYNVPIEYENILRSFFGGQTTERLVNLFIQYIAILQSLFLAQMNNDVHSVNSYTHQIYQVVDTIAEVFSEINPYWLKNEWVALLTAFTGMQIQGATMLLTEEYESNIKIFDRIISLSNVIGDHFSEGLTYYFMLNGPR